MEQRLLREIDKMPSNASGPLHRRAHSDTAFRLDDLLLFDPSDLDLSALDPPRDQYSDDSSNGAWGPPPSPSHRRSLSVDSDLCDGVFDIAEDKSIGKAVSSAGGRRVHHRHCNSTDGSVTASFELDCAMGIDGAKKAIGADRLAELALIDPKRAKRILANRQSAARSKERKIRYTNELERKVQTLQTEATNLSAQVTLLQRDSSGLSTENKELKLRLQAIEQEAKLKDALNEALREELQRLKTAAAQVSPMNGNPFNDGLAPQFLPAPPPLF